MQGGESVPTLYWRDRKKDGPCYHIDYIFLNAPMLAHVSELAVGSYDGLVRFRAQRSRSHCGRPQPLQPSAIATAPAQSRLGQRLSSQLARWLHGRIVLWRFTTIEHTVVADHADAAQPRRRLATTGPRSKVSAAACSRHDISKIASPGVSTASNNVPGDEAGSRRH